MQEQQHQIKIYGFIQRMVYAVVVMDCLTLFFQDAKIFVLSDLLRSFAKMGIFFPPINAKISTIILITLVAKEKRPKCYQRDYFAYHLGITDDYRFISFC